MPEPKLPQRATATLDTEVDSFPDAEYKESPMSRFESLSLLHHTLISTPFSRFLPIPQRPV